MGLYVSYIYHNTINAAQDALKAPFSGHFWRITAAQSELIRRDESCLEYLSGDDEDVIDTIDGY
jgi:hypothetical protein